MTIGDIPATPQSFGGWLRHKRMGRGQKQADIAAALGVAEPYVSQLETDSRRPSMQTAAAAANLFGEDRDYVLSLAGYPPMVDTDTTSPRALRALRIISRLTDTQLDLAIKLLEVLVDEQEQTQVVEDGEGGVPAEPPAGRAPKRRVGRARASGPVG